MRFVLLMLWMFGCALTLVAQEDTLYTEYDEYIEDVEPSIVHLVEAGLSINSPTAEFSDKVNRNTLWGFSGAFLRQLKLEQPAFVGVEFYHAHISNVRRTYAVLLTDEIIDVDGKLSSNIAGLNLLGRYYSNIRLGPVEPFLEIHIGLRSVYSYLSENGYFADDEPYSNFDNEEIDWSISYGGAIGLQTHVGDGWYINLKGSYEATNSTRYLRPIDDPNVFPLLPRDGFDLVQSPTNMFRFDIGVTYVY